MELKDQGRMGVSDLFESDAGDEVLREEGVQVGLERYTEWLGFILGGEVE
jgi:preprotein translocase subunit SecG